MPNSGLLEVIRFDDEEKYFSAYLHLLEEIAPLKKSIQEGEAQTFACAYANQWLVATDDIRAVKIIDTARPDTMPMITTPLIVQHFARSSSVSHHTIASICEQYQNAGTIYCIETRPAL